eukprot:1151676-Pelagomonas_calceolata.AAC.4
MPAATNAAAAEAAAAAAAAAAEQLPAWSEADQLLSSGLSKPTQLPPFCSAACPCTIGGGVREGPQDV